MKCMKRIFNLGLGLLLLCGLWACEQEQVTPSSALPMSSEPVSSAPVESEPLLESEPESSWFVPADDLIPSAPQEGEAEGFEAAFSQNPIDKAYDQAYELASSFSMMRQACDEAAGNWLDMVDISYDAALAVLSGDERKALQEEQDVWKDEVNDQIATLREENGDSNTGILSSGRAIVLLYRQRAMELCKIKYDIDGELPSFPGEGEAVG